MDQDRIVLKITAPRAHRSAIARSRLEALWNDVNGRAFIEVCAPGGFGKSTLLVHWRRLWLERGALAAWASLDAQDSPIRFARVLAHALRVASGRTSFDRIALEFPDHPERALDALTAVVAEIASLATPTVIILDDGEQLPEETASGALAYLLVNAPANLTVVLGTRAPVPLSTVELAAHGDFARVTVDDLRFDLDDSVALLKKRFGKRLELDDCVRLHELTEGWPIGLQLAAAAIERAPSCHSAVLSLSARGGDLERYFIESLLDRLPPEVAAFLTRIAILDPLSRELCAATTGSAMATAWLEQIMADTPIVTVAELQGWMRLHALARDFLLSRFEQLPDAEKAALHQRAAAWLAQHGFLPEASRHALAAGDELLAQTYVKQSLWSLATTGNLFEALQWIERLAPETLAADFELRLNGAWIMALGDRADRARPIAEESLRNPASTPKEAILAALVASAVEACSDRAGAIPAIMQRWPELPEYVTDPVHRLAHFNHLAIVALAEGDLAFVRGLDIEMPGMAVNRSLLFVKAISRMLVVLACLREPNPLRAEELEQPALVYAERTQGRRSTLACLNAVGLAAALYERNEIARADALLAHRVDVIERFVFPDAVMLAYKTLSRVAAAQGDERRALALLDHMEVFGRARGMPRFVLVSLALRIDLHVHKGHAEAAAALVPALDALAPTFEYPEYQLFLREYRLRRAMAHAMVALARFDPAGAETELAVAADLAREGGYGREALTIQVLRAVAANDLGSDRGSTLLAEALSIATMRGCLRVAEDAHPTAVAMRARLATSDAERANKAAASVAPVVRVSVPRAATTAGGLLTPKETDVLRLLAAGHSNKRIAKAMDISDETVKWHVKNLFSKLSAGTRQHAVDRARMMGLVVGEDATAV